MKPRGTAFGSTGEAVVGVNEAGEPQWHSCDECVDLGVAALREKIRAADNEVRTMTTDELVRLRARVEEEALRGIAGNGLIPGKPWPTKT